MTPLVSVILTSYNKPNTIANAIESVINQTYPNWELFIMDDNSNNETDQVIQQFLNDSRIHYFNSNIPDSERYKTTRYATLINEAIPKTSGKYITYLTDDNIFLPDRFQTMVNVLNQNLSIEIVYSQQLVRWLDENGAIAREVVRKSRRILTNPAGLVDHCSIMHTRIIADGIFRGYGSYWDDSPENWLYGDAVFWNRLTKFKPFHPIRKTLDIAFKAPESFQRLYSYLPKIIPNGTVVKGLSPDIYIIDNQKRRKISPEVFDKLKYHHNQVVSIPDPFLFKYNEGIPVDNNAFLNLALLPNQRLFQSSQNLEVYYIQNNKIHLIRNEKAFGNYKFHRQQIITVSEHLINQLPKGLPIEELSKMTNLPDGVLFKYQLNYYISFNNKFHPIEKLVAMKLNLPVSDPVEIEYSFLSNFGEGDAFSWQ